MLSDSTNPCHNASWHLVPSETLEAVCFERRCIVSIDQCGCDAVDLFLVIFIFNLLILLLIAEWSQLGFKKSFKVSENVMN